MNVAWDKDAFTLIPRPANNVLKRREIFKEYGFVYSYHLFNSIKCASYLIFVSQT